MASPEPRPLTYIGDPTPSHRPRESPPVVPYADTRDKRWGARAMGPGEGTGRRITMSRFKLTIRYARYALPALSSVALGLTLH